MIYTNKLNLPTWLTPDEEDHQFKENEYSVTELIQPIRCIKLCRKYHNNIYKDICDTIPALFGQAIHSFLESKTKDNPNLITEQKYQWDFNGNILKGRVDLIDGDMIMDYKTTSCSHVLKGDFTEWKLQGLMYAYLYLLNTGNICRKLKFIALLKDWSKIKSVKSNNYPSSGVFVWEYDIQDSDYDYIAEWIGKRFYEINQPGLPECTDEEKWYEGTTYAVYKKSNLKADKLFSNEQEAHDYIANKCDGVARLEVRKGDNLKCKYYCDACEFCKEENNG